MEKAEGLREHAEHGSRDRDLAPVSVTMAVLAVLAAALSLEGHRAQVQMLADETQAVDQWAYYQAKDIRLHTYQVLLDFAAVTGVRDPAAAKQFTDKYSHEVDRYGDQMKQIQQTATQAEKARELDDKRSDRFDLGELFAESALVLTSITFLTRRRVWWLAGMIFGCAGLVAGISAFFLR